MTARVALLEPVEKTRERKKEYGFPEPTLQKAKPNSWGLRNYLQLTIFLVTIGVRKKFWSSTKLGVVIIVLYVGLVYTATITGHWKSSVLQQEFRIRLEEINMPQYTHPGG
jgi:hypothetical protein